MARKTAMGKEPGNVSIALPQSEKDRLAGKKPVVSPPVKEQLKRMSPGVYRNSQGKLVGSKGQGLPKPSPIQNALQGAVQGAGQQAGMQPGQRQQMSPEAVNAGMQAGDLANSAIRDYRPYPQGQMPMTGSMQSGYLEAQPWQQQPIQDLMYRYPAGTTPPDMRLFAPYRPMNLAQQPQQPQQPQTVSGLLQRNR